MQTKLTIGENKSFGDIACAVLHELSHTEAEMFAIVFKHEMFHNADHLAGETKWQELLDECRKD